MAASAPSTDRQTPGSTPHIAILGAGISGLCMGIRLKQAGITNFTIFEKSDDVGGTWLDNSYPGAGCDVPSHLYSFSFEPNPNWSRRYSPQPEILAYFRHCARKYGIYPHIRFRTELAAARFDEAAGKWHLTTTAGEAITADVLVSGVGQLNRPAYPKLAGLETFAGTTFHSARWNHDYDLAGKRVAVVGTGASAIQFIPQIAPQVTQLHVFQRSPNWMIPRNDYTYSDFARWVFANVPLVQRLYRLKIYLQLEKNFLAFHHGAWLAGMIKRGATAYLAAQIRNPELRRILTPDYPIGCKRILISDDFYPSLERPNVEVVTAPIDHVTTDGIVTGDGRARPVDAIIYATGFEATKFLAPMHIEGLGGTALADAWRAGAEAHLGVSVAGFPNFFVLYGPNTNLGHNSIIFMIECQVDYVMQCVQRLMQEGLCYLDVRAEAMARYNAAVQRELERTVWTTACENWYKTESGRVTNNWSGFTLTYWLRTRHPDFGDFVLCPRT